MLIAAKKLLGVERIPSHRTSATEWLKNHDVAISRHVVNGGQAEFVNLSDLPSPERLAYLRRELDELLLDPGSYDDAAHEAFMRAAVSRRDRAERKAGIARMLVSLGPGVPWAERIALVRERFGDKGTSKPRLKAILKSVKGVDPVNFAPALLDDYKGRPERAGITPEAWRFFLTTLRDAAPEFPLKQAWRDARDVGRKRGWEVTSYSTFYRRWMDLPDTHRVAIRLGRKEAIKQTRQPALRDRTTLKAMDMLSLDGRTKDFWADWGDGKPVRSTFLPLVDIASGMVLHWLLARSENAADTVQLIVETCEKFGIPSQIYTDNGSAFAGHLVAGGTFIGSKIPARKRKGFSRLASASTLAFDCGSHVPKTVRRSLRSARSPICRAVLMTGWNSRMPIPDMAPVLPRIRASCRFRWSTPGRSLPARSTATTASPAAAAK